MSDKQNIILDHFRDGKKIREIHRERGFARKTISNYIDKYEEAREKLKNSGEEIDEELIEEIVEKPKYDTSNRKPRKVTPEIQQKIREYIQENKKKRNRGQKKQQMKKVDIHKALIEQDYDLSYSTVCNWVNRLKEENEETYIRRDHKPGDEVEFDWGYVKIFIDGELRQIPMAMFTCTASGYRYSLLCPKTDTKNFIHAHVKFFEHVEGVFQTMVYDNLSTAVKRIMKKGKKEVTEEFQKLSQYYLFDYRFCNIAKGNEKGSVEKDVEYVRRKAFCQEDKFESIAEANKYLSEVVEELNKKKPSDSEYTSEALFENEQEYLAELPPPYEYSYKKKRVVNKYSVISVDSYKYSVPDRYTGKEVSVRIYTDRIVVYDDCEQICKHTRQYGKQKYKLDINHYLDTFKKKPGGLSSSVAMNQAEPIIKKLYERYFTDNPKTFVQILELVREEEISLKDLEDIIERLLQQGIVNLDIEIIRDVLNKRKTKEKYPEESRESITADSIAEHSREQMESINNLIY